MATTERVDTNEKAAIACLEGTFGPIMGPTGALGEVVPQRVDAETERTWTLAQAQVYATLALVEEVRGLRETVGNLRIYGANGGYQTDLQTVVPE